MSTPTGLLDGLRAIRFLEAGGHPEPLLVLYHPLSPFNPFQRLLYAEGWSRGIVALPVRDLDEAEAIADVARGRVWVVLHLHWLLHITERAATAAAAAEEAATFLAHLDRLAEHDCRIAWTVHNVLPHDARHVEAAVVVRRGVVERSILVHALSASTPIAAAPWFGIPADRLVVIPHPSYAGVYPDTVARAAARFELGVWPDELVFLAFGAVRPYKGIPLLLDAWRAAATVPRTPRRLVVAGHAPPYPGRDELVLALEIAPDVVGVTDRVPVEAVQTYFRAADIAVLAHHEALNSGALLLALTFGLPVIAPRFAAALELLDDRVAILYEPGDRDGLVDALGRAPELVAGHPADHAREIAARFDPAEISRRFMEELRRRVGAAG
jgi:glycosyltransferase involved in cell wall biosynthesis